MNCISVFSAPNTITVGESDVEVVGSDDDADLEMLGGRLVELAFRGTDASRPKLWPDKRALDNLSVFLRTMFGDEMVRDGGRVEKCLRSSGVHGCYTP